MEQQGLRISKKAFIGSAAILLLLMLAAGVLTQTLPQSAFGREMVDGREVLLPQEFRFLEGSPLPFWRVFTAPFEVFASPDAVTMVSIMAFILVIGGTFLVLDKSGVLRYVMAATVRRFGGKKYRLLAVMTLLFMLFGSSIGIFEELVTLVPMGVALAFSLGWDSLVGLGMTGLAVGFGFATGMFNPFTVGIAQQVAGLPPFSGLWLRVIVFILVYALLSTFLYRYAKRIDGDPKLSLTYEEDAPRRAQYQDLDDSILQQTQLKKAAKLLGIVMLCIVSYILSAAVFPELSAYSLPVMAIAFTGGGLAAGRVTGYTSKLFKDFLSGMLAIAPGLILIMMAMSVKQIIVAGNVMDTLLYYAYNSMQSLSPYGAALLLYAFVLLMQFFIGSGSAKAVLIMPVVAPLATLVGLTRQSAVLAFCFGDGYTNVFYPTNPVLLIALGLAGVSYMKWFRWTWKLQLVVLVLTAGLLLFSVAIGYGPF